MNANKAWGLLYMMIIGAILLGILRHANQFKVAFGSISSFILGGMSQLSAKG